MKSIGAFAASDKGKSGLARPCSRRSLWPMVAALLGAMTFAAIGCDSSSKKTVVTPTPNPSQLYFSPAMGNDSLATYAIDQTANTFVRSTYSANGTTITDSGAIAAQSNGIVGLSASYVYGINGNWTLANHPGTSAPSEGWIVQLADQAALVQLDRPALVADNPNYSIPAATYFAPAVPTQNCPSIAKAETFQFVTLPERLASASATTINPGSWNPQLETAYGSVQITTSGSSVQLSGITQSTLPSANGGSSGPPSNPGPGSASAVCASTYYGQVISVPGTSVVTNPGGNESISAAATLGVGPSGFLVEDAGSSNVQGQPYNNTLGAASGAIGLPKPTSDITSSIVAAQFQGFTYAPGIAPTGFSLLSSFGGFANQQTACASLLSELAAASLTPSANTVYGGEFPAGAPPAGTGNCDLAIDLGTPGVGLYTGVTVYVGSAFPENNSGKPYSFPAVAVAGQLQGKDALFLIGADTTGTPSRAWGIYLLQSN